MRTKWTWSPMVRCQPAQQGGKGRQELDPLLESCQVTISLHLPEVRLEQQSVPAAVFGSLKED